MSPKDDEAAAAVEGHEEVIAADPQPSPPVDSINPEEAQWELPAERETCERHRQIIARLLFSKASQELEKDALKAEVVETCRKEAQRDRVLLVKALHEKFDQDLREQNAAVLKQYEQVKAFVMKELQEIKPLALKHAMEAYEKSLTRAGGALHYVNPVLSEPDDSDNEGDQAESEDMNDLRPPTLDDDLMQISPSPAAKSAPAKQGGRRKHNKAASTYGNLDDDLERELLTVLQRKALRRRIADEEEDLRAEERREMKSRWDDEMRSQVNQMREELTEQFKAQLEEERDKIRLLVSAEAEVEREQREAALEERIRNEYEGKIKNIMQSLGLE